MRRVDLNCDLGESFGAWTLGGDAAVLPHITSANVACGFHAGDPGVMRRTVAAAVEHGVAVGAHPGLQDLAGFGRRAMQLTPQEAYDLVVYQVGALQAVAATHGATVKHVKPHGALYNMAAVDEALAEAIARAVRDIDPRLALFALSGSALAAAGESAGLVTVAEAFPDRGYAADGTLLPRSHPRALVSDPAAAAARAVRMVVEQAVEAEDGTVLSMASGTLCIHGDGPDAPAVAAAIRRALLAADACIEAPA